MNIEIGSSLSSGCFRSYCDTASRTWRTFCVNRAAIIDQTVTVGRAQMRTLAHYLSPARVPCSLPPTSQLPLSPSHVNTVHAGPLADRIYAEELNNHNFPIEANVWRINKLEFRTWVNTKKANTKTNLHSPLPRIRLVGPRIMIQSVLPVFASILHEYNSFFES